jgi:hypothetical protein
VLDDEMEEVEVHVETFYNELWESNGFLTQAQIVLPPFDEDTSIGAGHVCVQIVFGNRVVDKKHDLITWTNINRYMLWYETSDPECEIAIKWCEINITCVIKRTLTV